MLLFTVLLCLGVWLVLGGITATSFIKKYQNEIEDDSIKQAAVLCLLICLCGPLSRSIIWKVEKTMKELDNMVDNTEKTNEDG